MPHLVDSEVTNVLRGLVRRGDLTDEQAGAALSGFAALTLTRFPAEALRPRMWELRHNLSGYDATYVALARIDRRQFVVHHRCPPGPHPRHPVCRRGALTH